MQLTKRHLRVFDNYQGKKSSLEKVGSPKEKELFQNGEFEKIQRLITNEYKLKSKELSAIEIQNHQVELNAVLKGIWNRKAIKYLSNKYGGPDKEKSTFSSIMEMLWAMFG